MSKLKVYKLLSLAFILIVPIFLFPWVPFGYFGEKGMESMQEPPILALVDYTSHSGKPDEADGIAIVDLNPRSQTFGQILQQAAIGKDVRPHHLYYNHDGSRLYTTALGGSALYRVILNKNKITEITPLNATPCAVGEDLYFTENGQKFYLTCMGSSQVIIFDAGSERKIDKIEALPPNEPYFLNPHGISADERIDRLIITNTMTPQMDQQRTEVTIIEISSNKVLSTHPIFKYQNEPSAPVEVFFLPDRPVAFVTGAGDGTLWVAEWNKKKKAFEFNLVDDGTTRGHSWPLEIYLGPDKNLYVSFAQPGIVNVYDLSKPTAPRLIKTLPAGAGAHHIAFSKDGQYMFVQNNLLTLEKMDAGTISIVDLKSGKLVATVDSFIKQGLQPESIVLLEQSGTLAKLATHR